MKFHFTFLLIALMVATLASCKKECSVCSYHYTDWGGNDQLFEYPEACGKKEELQTYEDSCKAAGTLAGFTVSCVREKDK